jgi:hypothetical protein
MSNTMSGKLARDNNASPDMTSEEHASPDSDAPAIQHYISALAASGVHQKLVMNADDPKRARNTESKGEVTRSRSLAVQRRERRRKQTKQTVVDIMVRKKFSSILVFVP